jgi:hypothetical protein
MRGGVQATPLVMDGIMHLTGPWSTVYSMGMPDFGDRLTEEEATLIHAWIVSEIEANVNIN